MKPTAHYQYCAVLLSGRSDQALKAKKIAGAGLDVRVEPLSRQPALPSTMSRDSHMGWKGWNRQRLVSI